MTGFDEPALALAFYAVASLAAYLTFSVASRLAVSRRHAGLWLVVGSCTLGLGIWSMHFLGLRAYHLRGQVGYDPNYALASLGLALLASALTLHTLDRDALSSTRLVVSGLIIGCAIAMVHYVGMASMHIQPSPHYRTGLATLSLAVAVLASILALRLAFDLRASAPSRATKARIAAALVMGLGITGLHYIGVASVAIVPGSPASGRELAFQDDWLAIVVGFCSVTLMGIVTLLQGTNPGAHASRAARVPSIRLRIGVAFVVVVVLVAGFGVACLFVLLDAVSGFAAYDARDIATMVARADGESPRDGTRLQRMIDRIYQASGREVFVLDEDLVLIAGPQGAKLGQRFPGSEAIERTLQDEMPRTFTVPLPEGAGLAHRLAMAFHRDPDDNGTEGHGVVVVDYTQTHEILRRETRYAVAWIAAIGTAVALAIALLGLRMVGLVVPRLVALRRRSDALAAGDFGTRVDTGAQDEIGVLESAFNSMACDIEQAHLKLLAQQRELEDRVRVRTAELALAEEAQRRVAEELRLVTENIPVGICYLDSEERLRQYNGQFADILGLPAHVIAGAKLETLLTPAHFAMIRTRRQEVYSGHTVVYERDKVPGKPGSGIVQVTMVPRKAAGGQVVGCFGMLQDISESKHDQDALRRRNEELRASNDKLREAQRQLLQAEKMASIGQLASGVAHEINNPIGYVYSNLGTLEHYLTSVFMLLDRYEEACQSRVDEATRLALDEAARDADLAFVRADVTALLAESKEGVDRVKKIVVDLRNFSRSSSGEKLQWASLEDGLDSTLNIVMNELKYKAEIRKEYGNLPPVQCRPSQLNQVFMNVLVNAADAIESRGVIAIRTGVEHPQVWVEIEDSGCGIAQENVDRIFEPFFTTKPVGKGTGLGLAVSYGIVAEHHGRIEVRSAIGKGTAFRVWLPIQQAVEGANGQAGVVDPANTQAASR